MRTIAEAYLAAMQQGPDGHEALLALFADDAIYIEPFGGNGPHVGRDAIRAYLAASTGQAPPQLRLTIERIDVDGPTVEATWRCESPIFRRPSRGRDRFTVRAGQIVRLETSLIEPPELLD